MLSRKARIENRGKNTESRITRLSKSICGVSVSDKKRLRVTKREGREESHLIDARRDETKGEGVWTGL